MVGYNTAYIWVHPNVGAFSTFSFSESIIHGFTSSRQVQMTVTKLT